MNSIFTYIFLGITMAATFGPVKNVLLNTGLKNGFFHAWFFSLGALTTDIVYMFVVYFGVGKFIDSLLLQTILWSFGCFVLLYTGIESLLTLHKIEMNSKTGKIVRLRHSLLAGLLMSLLNPITILFWLGIYGSILAKTAGIATGLDIILISGAILLGIIFVDFLYSSLSSIARKFLSINLLKTVTVISSIFMIGFGIYFGKHAFQFLF
ncbi:homoserine/Threonine efflux protein [Solibacillus isronensis B3W22]|uniref:Homoserine/Threonine efflux protein n=1 Tax=Solibacillus isronensis B3W22 TaxID=1224748 RepID=K1LQ50_9BACL|nr:LysE family transporter [Solibacillus isronensis]AMO85698.1 amino acid transporter [Solibacillus silvestris]EKB46344.1 homoserine/Threonine efflux protein [Solibacillus isronensis B3W22]